MTSSPGNGIAIMGATATGKSEVAIRLAEHYDGEIISMDSRQVYRGLDIGTAKVSLEDRSRAPHHLIDVLDPKESNSAGKHLALVREASRAIASRRRLLILAGGTGLYFRAFFEGLIDAGIPEEELASIRAELSEKSTADLRADLERVDPERATQLSTNDRIRIARALEIFYSTGKQQSRHVSEQKKGPTWPGLKIVLSWPRAELRERIAERTRAMFAAGWIDEVRALLAKGVSRNAPGMRSLGYEEIAEALEKGTGAEEVMDSVITRTQQYAKRQETFFRSVKSAVWIDMSEANCAEKIENLVKRHLSL